MNEVKNYLKKIGKRGGKKTAIRGSEYYRELQKKSVVKRKENKKFK